jgi:hypothetical protein
MPKQQKRINKNLEYMMIIVYNLYFFLLSFSVRKLHKITVKLEMQNNIKQIGEDIYNSKP